MTELPAKNQIPEEILMSKIYLLRGQKVMIDFDLAVLYGIKTKRLNEQVKRNILRFPDDFMFELNEEELENLRSQIATSSWGGRRTLPYAFSEHGVLMLSSVLKSDMAIKVNIQIMRVYIKIRELVMLNASILSRIEKIEKSIQESDKQVLSIFEYLKHFEMEKQQIVRQNLRKRVGFKRNEN